MENSKEKQSTCFGAFVDIKKRVLVSNCTNKHKSDTFLRSVKERLSDEVCFNHIQFFRYRGFIIFCFYVNHNSLEMR